MQYVTIPFMKKLINLFKKLVEIPSPSGKEEEISEFVTNYCSERGIDLSKDKYGNIFFPNKDSILLLTAHLDTVQGNEQIQFKEIDGVIRSKGDTILGADDKANLASILGVVDYYYENDIPYNFELLFTVEEELGMKGAKNFDYEKLHSNDAISFDKSGEEFGSIVTAAPYGYSITIEIIGKAAHSSMPEEANNVIPSLTLFLSELPLGRVETNTTINIGTVDLGRSANTVPGEAFLKGDIRSLDQTVAKRYIQQIKQITEKITNGKIKSSIQINEVISGYKIDDDNPLLAKVTNTLYQKLERKPKEISSNSGSDASILNANGINTILIASGAKGCHTKDESIAIRDLQNIYEVLLSLLGNK